MKSRVLHEIRHGLIVARVRRLRRRGGHHHSISVHRLYRNGEIWTESSRFAPDDIPSMRFVLDEAHNWIIKQVEWNSANSQQSASNHREDYE